MAICGFTASILSLDIVDEVNKRRGPDEQIDPVFRN